MADTGVKIYVPSYDVWDFYTQNSERLQDEEVIIAENTSTEHVISMTGFGRYPRITAYRESEKVEEDFAMSSDDANTVARKMYTKYLFPITVSEEEIDKFPDDSELEELNEDNMESAADIIYQRDDELDLAFSDFLDTVWQLEGQDDSYVLAIGERGELLDRILSILSEYYPVYRPTVIENRDGVQCVCSFPYDLEE